MKKSFISIFCIILVFILCSCGNKATVETNKTSNETSPKVDQSSTTKENSTAPTLAKDVTIEILPPAGWEPNKDSVLPVHYMKETTSFMVKQEPYQSKDLEGVISEAQEIFKGAFDDVKFEVESEDLTIDGKEAKKMIFTCKVSGMEMKYEYDFLFVEEKVYVITFGGLSDSFDSLSSDYEQIINDIRFK